MRARFDFREPMWVPVSNYQLIFTFGKDQLLAPARGKDEPVAIYFKAKKKTQTDDSFKRTLAVVIHHRRDRRVRLRVQLKVPSRDKCHQICPASSFLLMEASNFVRLPIKRHTRP